MIDVGPYSFSILTAVTAVVAAFWLVTLLLAAVLPAGRSGHGIRRVDVFVIVLTVAFGLAWFAGLLYTPPKSKSQPVTTRSQSCVSVKVGQPESKVRELLGEPDEIRSDEEVRGPGADVWIYRDSRCAVHYMLGSVISVE
jgi:hypothetical protein